MKSEHFDSPAELLGPDESRTVVLPAEITAEEPEADAEPKTTTETIVDLSWKASLMVNPQLELQFQVSEARAKGDIETLVLLTEMRPKAANAYDYLSFRSLSEGLIQAGDPDEPRIAYQAAGRSFDELGWQLLHKLKIARLLRQT